MLLNMHGYWVNTDRPGGRVFFVGGGTVAFQGKGASDVFDGSKPETPLATIAQAHTLAVAGRGDTIVLLPGGVTITAAIAITKADLTLMGVSQGKGVRGPSVITCATNSVEMISIDADNVTVKDLVLDHNATTADVFLIDVGDTSAVTGCLLENLFIDMEGSATTTNAIRLGDGTNAVVKSVVKDCTLHGLDDIGITLSAGSDENQIVGNVIYDAVQFATAVATDAVNCAGDGCTLSNNEVRVGGTTGFSLVGTLNQLNNNRISAGGANTIGILLADGATAWGNGNVVTAIAAGNLIDATTDADSPTVFADFGNVHAADPATAAFVTPTVDGS